MNQFRPNGNINYVNPNHPVNLNFVQGMNNPGNQMPNFQGPNQPQQQMNQQPQQNQMNQPNYTNQVQNQAPPPQKQQGNNNKRNRRTDVLDLQNKNNAGGSRNGNKRSGKESGLSNSKKRGNSNNSKEDKINKHRAKRMTGGNSEQQKMQVVSDLQNNLQMLGVLQKQQVVTRSADAAIGHFDGVLEDQDQVGAFFEEMGRTCPTNSIIIPSNSYQLPKITIDTAALKIRHIFVKFSTDWFNEVCMQIYKENNKDQEDTILMEGQEAAQLVSTIDVFNKISELTEQQISSIRAHYKPTGLIYVIVASGNMIDGIIAAHCIVKKIPIIQVNHEGQGDIMEVQDRTKRARKFATRVNEVAKNYATYVREKKSKALVPNEMFCIAKNK